MKEGWIEFGVFGRIKRFFSRKEKIDDSDKGASIQAQQRARREELRRKEEQAFRRSITTNISQNDILSGSNRNSIRSSIQQIRHSNSSLGGEKSPSSVNPLHNKVP